MYKLTRVLSTVVLLVIVSWSAHADPAPTTDQIRQFLRDISAHIDVEAADLREVCTGWVGWSQAEGSALYTAGHCFRDGARYRLTFATGETVYASSSVRWNELDLLALWIPRGGLRALRSWKQIPDTPFQALYVLNVGDGNLELVEAQVPRVHWEIRFKNSPGAVAIPIYVLPGTSGAPVLDLTDGLLLGMIVGHAPEQPDLTAVIPARLIYKALSDSAKSR